MCFRVQNRHCRTPDIYPLRLFQRFRQVFCIYMSPSSAAESIYSPSESIYSPSMYSAETISPRSISLSSSATFRLSPPGFFICVYIRNLSRFTVILL